MDAVRSLGLSGATALAAVAVSASILSCGGLVAAAKAPDDDASLTSDGGRDAGRIRASDAETLEASTVGCDGCAHASRDAERDVARDVSRADGGADTGRDGGLGDAQHDVAADSSGDAGRDGPSDARYDAPVDAGHDALADAGYDALLDGAHYAPGDASPDAPVDAGHEAGPTSTHLTGQSIAVNTATGVQTRTYDITIPTTCEAQYPMPLVFAFHGDGADGASMYGANFPIEAAAAAAGGQAVFVYPDGTDRNRDPSGADRAWDLFHDPGPFPYAYTPGTPVPAEPFPAEAGASWVGGDASGNVDVDFFDTMVEAFEATYPCIDPTTVFITGMSEGGFFANQLARWRSSVVTGTAPQSGGAPFGNLDGSYGVDGGPSGASDWAPPNYCVASTGAVPAIIIHGSDDSTVDVCNAIEAQSYWELTNSCSGSANNCTKHADSCTGSDLADPSSAPTTASALNSLCVQSIACSAPVVFCEIPGMGHQIWSDAPQVIWSFFASL